MENILKVLRVCRNEPVLDAPTAYIDSHHGHTPLKTCVDRLVSWAQAGRLLFSNDAASLVDAVTKGGSGGYVPSGGLDLYIVAEQGLQQSLQNIYELCPEIDISNHGTVWLRGTLGSDEYLKQYHEHARNFCTCEYGGPYLCINTALDDAPTIDTVGRASSSSVHGGTNRLGLFDHDSQDTISLPQALDDDRGSAFWSVKYQFGPSYWLPGATGTKALANNRIFHFANAKSELYLYMTWVRDNVAWCQEISPQLAFGTAGRQAVPLHDLLAFMDSALAARTLSEPWVEKLLSRMPCAVLNAQAQLNRQCPYLQAVLDTHGDSHAEKRLYEGYHGVQLSPVDSRSAQKRCYSQLLDVCESCTNCGPETVCGIAATQKRPLWSYLEEDYEEEGVVVDESQANSTSHSVTSELVSERQAEHEARQKRSWQRDELV
eukprot:COSAG05_NODE_2744_length_2701_cov_2.618755_1_plen_431_part_10